MSESKILIMGLSNAGKTSIVNSLKGIKNLNEYLSLKPTKHISRDVIQKSDDKYFIWDFGGQKRYIDEYKQDLNSSTSNYFQNIEKIIFVIDVQDENRHEEALDYLKVIVEAIKEQYTSIKFSIFIHKYDPGLEIEEKYSYENLKEGLVAKIDDIFPENFDHDIFTTTIFTVFQKSFIF